MFDLAKYGGSPELIGCGETAAARLTIPLDEDSPDKEIIITNGVTSASMPTFKLKVS